MEKQKTIDDKIKSLLLLTDDFIITEFYTHTNKMMYKIINPYTNYRQEKLVLCSVDEGIEKAIDFAIDEIQYKKNEFFGEDTSI